MKRISLSQSGFGHAVIIVTIVVLGGIGLAGWYVMSKQDDTSTNNQSQQSGNNEKKQASDSSDEKDIELQNLGMASIADGIAIDQNAVREFSNMGLKGYYNFGDPLSGGRINPNFEYASVKPGTAVIAAIDGVIGFIRQQPETNDYEVFLQPKEGSAWTIGYDHIVDVTVKKGDTVKVGDKLGEAAKQNNGVLRFEFQVNKDKDRKTTHICPSTLLSPSVKDKITAELTAMQTSWEQKTGLELYDTSKQSPAGCIQQTLTPEQAEGKS